MEVLRAVINELRERIKEASDLEFQKKLWLDEDYLFDLHSFFVRELSFSEIDALPSHEGFSPDFKNALKSYIILLTSYGARVLKHKSISYILRDPEWQKIVEYARLVSSMFRM